MNHKRARPDRTICVDSTNDTSRRIPKRSTRRAFRKLENAETKARAANQ